MLRFDVILKKFGQGKISMSQIRMTEVITNQKDITEGIPSLLQWKSYKLDILAIFWNVKLATLKSAGASFN